MPKASTLFRAVGIPWFVCRSASSSHSSRGNRFAYVSSSVVDVRIDGTELASTIQAGNRLVVRIENLRLPVALRPTLGVDERGAALDRIERRLELFEVERLDRFDHLGKNPADILIFAFGRIIHFAEFVIGFAAVKVRIDAIGTVLVVLVYRFRKRFRIASELFCKLFDSVVTTPLSTHS